MYEVFKNLVIKHHDFQAGDPVTIPALHYWVFQNKCRSNLTITSSNYIGRYTYNLQKQSW